MTADDQNRELVVQMEIYSNKVSTNPDPQCEIITISKPLSFLASSKRIVPWLKTIIKKNVTLKMIPAASVYWLMAKLW